MRPNRYANWAKQLRIFAKIEAYLTQLIIVVY